MSVKYSPDIVCQPLGFPLRTIVSPADKRGYRIAMAVQEREGLGLARYRNGINSTRAYADLCTNPLEEQNSACPKLPRFEFQPPAISQRVFKRDAAISHSP